MWHCEHDFARRYALIEIDVLVAQALGLSLEQLTSIYKSQFPVLAENEEGTWYDTERPDRLDVCHGIDRHWLPQE